MKFIRLLLAATMMTSVTTACFDDKDTYNAGFLFYKPQSAISYLFANNTADSIVIVSYGEWNMTFDPTYSSDWCTLTQTTGHGNVLYRIPVAFTPNTTDKGRMLRMVFMDTTHPNDASAAIYYWQYATRGDGSMGNAPCVKAISGSDGSLFELNYDNLQRPTLLRITPATDAGISPRVLTLSYNDYDSTMTVTDNQRRMTSKYQKDYQPERLIGETDTIGYYAQYYTNGMMVSANQAFNVEHHHRNLDNIYYALRLGGQSLQADSLHCADSLRIATVAVNGDGTTLKKYKMTYADTDNRRQSVDANQLVFGAAACDPYQLLGLFRYARNTSVVSSLTTENEADRISVSTTLNINNSIQTLTVVKDGNSTTYNFEY